MTPGRFGEIIRPFGRNDLRPFPPPYDRIMEPPNRHSDSYELRLGMSNFEKSRFVYGYVGATKRLFGSKNTITSSICQIVVKIGRVDEDLPYPEHRCCFARILAYSSDFADQFLGPECVISVRDFVSGYVTATHSDGHAGSNLNFWRFASMAG